MMSIQSLPTRISEEFRVFISIKVSANLALMFYIIVLGISYTDEVFVVHLPKFKALHI